MCNKISQVFPPGLNHGLTSWQINSINQLIICCQKKKKKKNQSQHKQNNNNKKVKV